MVGGSKQKLALRERPEERHTQRCQLRKFDFRVGLGLK